MSNLDTTLVVPENLERCTLDGDAATRAGFRLPQPLYAMGRPVNSTGRANLSGSRRAFESLPTSGDALAGLKATIAAEDRRECLVNTSDLKMLPTGDLYVRDRAADFGLEERGFLKLAASITPGGADYLAECPTALRASNMNHWLDEAARGVKLRHRVDVDPARRSDRVVWGVVGPKYPTMDANLIADLLDESLPAGARAEVVYDGFKTRIHVQYHTDIKPEACAAGEIFKAGMVFTTADDGTRSITGHASVVRNLCLNLIILGKSTITLGNKAHRGTLAEMRESVKQMVAAGNKGLEHFSTLWTNAEKDRVIDAGSNPHDTFEALVQRGLVKAPGIEKDAFVNRLVRAWQKEPGYTRASIVNAVTRAAHTESWRLWVGDSLEEQAGQLLHVKQLRLN